KFYGESQIKGNEQFGGRGTVGDRFDDLSPDLLGRILAHWLAALPAMKLSDVRPEHFHVVANLGHRSDSRASRFDGIALLDGDGGRDAFDAVHLRLVHPVEELARVRRKSFDIAALPFGKECIEGQRAFAAAAQAGNDDELLERQI